MIIARHFQGTIHTHMDKALRHPQHNTYTSNNFEICTMNKLITLFRPINSFCGSKMMMSQPNNDDWFLAIDYKLFGIQEGRETICAIL